MVTLGGVVGGLVLLAVGLWLYSPALSLVVLGSLILTGSLVGHFRGAN